MSALPVIGCFPLTNAGAVLIHRIDYGEEKVLASINGKNPELYSMTTEQTEDGGYEPGIRLGFLFVPFSQVQRIEV